MFALSFKFEMCSYKRKKDMITHKITERIDVFPLPDAPIRSTCEKVLSKLSQQHNTAYAPSASSGKRRATSRARCVKSFAPSANRGGKKVSSVKEMGLVLLSPGTRRSEPAERLMPTHLGSCTPVAAAFSRII